MAKVMPEKHKEDFLLNIFFYWRERLFSSTNLTFNFLFDFKRLLSISGHIFERFFKKSNHLEGII